MKCQLGEASAEFRIPLRCSLVESELTIWVTVCDPWPIIHD